MLALFNSSSEVNAIYLTFAQELGLPIRPTDVRVQKIDSITLDTFGIVVTAFLVINKANQVRFFKEIVLVANISPEVVFGIFFLILSSADIDFLGREFRWRTYITKKALLTTKRVKLVGKKEFAITTLDSEHKTYIVHVRSVSSVALSRSFPLKVDIHTSHRP